MTHSAEHHIEHAEHAAHAAGDGFNKQVTMSIAIVAAVLACVTMLGHRAHNDTLRLQGEALELQTKAGIKSTEAANKWAYYQGKNTFNLLSEIMLDSLTVLATRDDRKDELKEVTKRYEGTVEYYSGDKKHRTQKQKEKKAEDAPKGEVAKANNGDEGDAKKKKEDGHDKEAKKKDDGHAKAPGKKEGKLKHIEEEAREVDKESKVMLDESKVKLTESHEVHQRTVWLDGGELGLQFGVVLCSLAILTRGRSLWFMGLLSAVVGAVVAAIGHFSWFTLFMGGHH
jgi:hypothetical protein